MALPTLKILEPHFRPGTVLVADNTIASRQGYADFFRYIEARESRYKTLTLPFAGGLEMVRTSMNTLLLRPDC